eukprot:365969-Chlamydomonas_euryale.AAC.10
MRPKRQDQPSCRCCRALWRRTAGTYPGGGEWMCGAGAVDRLKRIGTKGGEACGPCTLCAAEAAVDIRRKRGCKCSAGNHGSMPPRSTPE